MWVPSTKQIEKMVSQTNEKALENLIENSFEDAGTFLLNNNII